MFGSLLFFIAFAVSADCKDFTQRLTRVSEINSGSFNEEGLAKVARVFADDFQQIGITLGWDLRTRSLVGEWGSPSATRKILAVGHLDTVFEPFHPFQKVSRTGDRLRGPGVADAKGGVVLMRDVIRDTSDLVKSGKLQWKIFIAGDEEIGSRYSKEKLIQMAKTADWALVFEPGWFDLALNRPRVPASIGGNIQISLAIQAPESHSGASLRQGVGALDTAAWVVTELGTLRSPSVSMNFYESHHKSKPNVAGGQAELKLSVRYETDEEGARIRERLSELKRKAKERDQVELHWKERTVWTPQVLSDPKLVKLWQAAYREEGLPEPIPSVSLTRSASSFLALAGVKVLDSCGPYGSGYHSDVEEVWLESVDLRRRLLTKLVGSLVLTP